MADIAGAGLIRQPATVDGPQTKAPAHRVEESYLLGEATCSAAGVGFDLPTPCRAIVAGCSCDYGRKRAGKSTARAMIEEELSPMVERVELAQVLPPLGLPALHWKQQAT